VRLSLSFTQACALLEQQIERVDGQLRLKHGRFIDALEHISGVSWAGIPVPLFAAQLRTHQDPVPPALLAKLDLAPGSSIHAVADALEAIAARRDGP
jgi:hypothetical protein